MSSCISQYEEKKVWAGFKCARSLQSYHDLESNLDSSSAKLYIFDRSVIICILLELSMCILQTR